LAASRKAAFKTWGRTTRVDDDMVLRTSDKNGDDAAVGGSQYRDVTAHHSGE
jgi:hypothetical protein